MSSATIWPAKLHRWVLWQTPSPDAATITSRTRRNARLVFPLFLIGSFLHAPLAFAQTSRQTAIYFGNGIFTTPLGAQEARGELIAGLRAQLTAAESRSVTVGIAANSTEGVLDLFEAVSQDLTTDFTSKLRWLADVERMPAFFQEAFQQVAISLDEQSLFHNRDLAAHVATYQDHLALGTRVICVPHSQGNFFVNQSFGLLGGSYHLDFNIVSVANPDSFVADDGGYTTLHEDKVILAIRVAKVLMGLPTPMRSNVSNSIWNVFTTNLNHEFSRDYMARGTLSREKIIRELVEQVRK